MLNYLLEQHLLFWANPAFKKAKGSLNCNFTSCLEYHEVPLWNNIMATKDNSVMGSPLLKSVGITHIKDVVGQNKLITYQEIAEN